MQPIIRHTIRITITEIWTITWPNGRETVWSETHEVASPVASEPAESLPLLTIDEEIAHGVLASTAVEPPVADE